MKKTTFHGDDGSPFLTRWKLASLFGYDLLLHKIHRADNDRCCHDHPWHFVSLVLWGGYVEEVEEAEDWLGERFTKRRLQHNRPGALLFRRATHTHCIESVPQSGCWTLLIRSPPVRPWGFRASDGTWVPQSDFLNAKDGDRIAWCEDREHA
jgi:hypothetical protein